MATARTSIHRDPRRASFGVVLIALAVVGCGGTLGPGTGASVPAATTSAPTDGASSGAPSQTPGPVVPSGRATTFDAFADAYCAAWSSIFEAVGNPDIGSGSDMTARLYAAIESVDSAATERSASDILAVLARGRAQVAVAGGWEPATAAMAEMDRFIRAYEAMIDAAKRSLGQGKAAATAAGQAAFQAAGGVDAWYGMRAASGPIQSARPASATPRACPGVPVSL